MSVLTCAVRMVAFLILFPALCRADDGPGKVIIEGTLRQVSDNDSVSFYFYPYGLGKLERKYTVGLEHGHFKLVLNHVEKPQYVEIYFPKSYPHMARKYLIEPGDEIQIKGDVNQIVYSGKGSVKFRCSDTLAQLYFSGIRKLKSINKELAPSLSLYQGLDSLAAQQVSYLSKNRGSLSSSAFNLIKIDILAAVEIEKDLSVLYSNIKKDSALRASINQSLDGYENDNSRKLVALVKSRPSLAATSTAFCQFVYSRYNIDSFVLQGKPFNLLKYLDYVLNNYSGLLREELLTDVIYKFKNRDSNIGTAVVKAKRYIRNEEFKNLLSEISSNNSVGAKAFNFSLQDANGKFHSLSDYRGKVVILDFWYTGCTNCIGENRQLVKLEKLFEKDTNVVFVSISTDTNKDKWIESVNSGKYTTETRINLFTNGQGHPLLVYHSVDAFPTLIIIDRDGNLAEKPADPRSDNGKSLIEVIEKYRSIDSK